MRRWELRVVPEAVHEPVLTRHWALSRAVRDRAGFEHRVETESSDVRGAPDVRHLTGRANAMISSLVTSDPVSPPPVLTTVTNCRPSAPR